MVFQPLIEASLLCKEVPVIGSFLSTEPPVNIFLKIMGI